MLSAPSCILEESWDGGGKSSKNSSSATQDFDTNATSTSGATGKA